MSERAPAAEHARPGRLGRLFAPREEADEPVRRDSQYRRVEELIMGGPRRYTRAQLVAESGMDRELAVRLWRSLGFAEVGDDEVVFTSSDRAALRQLEQLRKAGLVPADVEDAVARSVGQAMAGLADWQVEMLYQLVDYGHSVDQGGLGEQEMAEIAERVIPLLEYTQDYVWRRHLAAAAVRLLAAAPEESDTRTVTVGFADLVGFTRASRRLGPTELTALLEDFHALATDVVATCGGRVVKTVGDEVLFSVDEPIDGAEIALRLIERLDVSPSPLTTSPRLRVGVANGEVVTRFGDVYGEAVNIAARLTANARPGRVLVDRNLAAALDGDDRFRLDSRRPLAVRGYRHLQQWELRRTE